MFGQSAEAVERATDRLLNPCRRCDERERAASTAAVGHIAATEQGEPQCERHRGVLLPRWTPQIESDGDTKYHPLPRFALFISIVMHVGLHFMPFSVDFGFPFSFAFSSCITQNEFGKLLETFPYSGFSYQRVSYSSANFNV